MNKYNMNTKFREVFEEPIFENWKHMLDFRRDTTEEWLEELSFGNIKEHLSGWSGERMLEGSNYLYECAQKQPVFYPIWDDDELENQPQKQLTGIAAFPLSKKSKFAVICPGGGYGAVCAILEGYPLAKQLNDMGYAAFVVGYRAGKAGVQPAPQEDLAAAVRFILQNETEFQLDTEAYAVIGFSAGAHLAGSFGIPAIGYDKYHLPKPGVMFLGYPVVTMGEMAHMGSRNNFLGEEMANNPVLQERYSLEKQITYEYPKTFLWQCDGDNLVPFANSQLLAKALENYHVPHCYEVFHYQTHGLCDDADEYAKNWLVRAVEFWKEK